MATNPEVHESVDNLDTQDWPISGLESVSACPACGGQRRRVLYDDLQDNVFFCSPGKWALHECLDCSSAYLDPRPTPETIHLAYRTYYTHKRAERTPTAKLRGLSYLQRAMANGYRNWRFNATLKPSTALGVPFAFLFPFERAAIEHEFRHLPRTATQGRLLDVGFGDGVFLEKARDIGWDVSGIDLDPKVVENALKRGLNVYQGDLEVLAGMENEFDVITMSHVIEHVHHPTTVLAACHRLLKPGGRLWIETPNISSLGRSRFQSAWRGLETPRHLVIFNRQSLCEALDRVGFADVRDAPQISPCSIVYAMSERMKNGADPYIEAPVSAALKVKIVAARFVEWWLKSRREFVSITAKKAQPSQ